MPNYTQNLKLHKYDPETDGNTTFDIVDAINSPFDIIDDALGGQMVPAPPTPITLTTGNQVITVDRDTPFAVLNIQGRTLVNLLGHDGNCESLTGWTAASGNIELDPDNRTVGRYGFKLVSDLSPYGAYKDVNIDNSGHYIVLGDLKVDTATDVSLKITKNGFSMIASSDPYSGKTFKTQFVKLSPTDLSGVDIIRIYISLTADNPGKIGYMDGIRLYKITEAEYNAIGSMTPEEIAAKYPYVDSIQNVNAVYTTTKAEDGRESYMYLPTCQLASNLDGSLADTMYMDNEGKPRAVRQFRRVELDGSLDWRDIDIRYPNFKQVIVSNFTSNYANQGNFVKYDGTILENFSGTPTGPDLATISQSNGELHVTIANSDSGWGPDYTPTQEEIKAYFWGWKMYDENIKNDGTSLYNGETGAIKRWTPLESFDGNRYYGVYSGKGTPKEVPSSANLNSTYRKHRDWTPYLFQYQLAAPVDEPLEHEGSLMLYEGSNQVEVGAGIVVREKVDPFLGNGKWNINNTNWSRQSVLDHQARYLKEIYKDGVADKTWSRVNNPESINGQFAQSLYGVPSSVYQVTYLALDTYKIGIAPTEISAEYAANLRGTVDSLVEGNKNALARISVLENETAMKEQPQWIAPTLLNGWVNHNETEVPAGYIKDSRGFVHIRGTIRGGSTSAKTVIFRLPPGYRPSKAIGFAAISKRAAENVMGRLYVEPDGNIVIFDVANDYLFVTLPAFEARQ